jgi:hypothetical protein
MKIKYLHHHLGLGDHFCCNGLVLELIKRWNVDKLVLFCWKHNLSALEKLYQNTKVELVPLEQNSGEQRQVESYLRQRNVSTHHNGQIDWKTGNSGNYFKLGFDWMERECHNKISQYVSCDQCFYLQADVPYELRFDGFTFNRNNDEENRIYNELNPNNEPYVFVAIDDPSRGMVAPSRKCLTTNLKIIENPKEHNVLHLGKLLENAEEVHVMDSSIRCMIDCRKVFNMTKPKLFIHAWRGCIWGNSTLLSWNIIWQDCFQEKCERKYPMYTGENGSYTIKGYKTE